MPKPAKNLNTLSSAPIDGKDTITAYPAPSSAHQRIATTGTPLVIAVAGQPNTGKSTVFNKLTGLKQRVGNWPGKTVDRKEGLVKCNDQELLFVDLPGTYGLTANSLEEEIARDYLLSDSPDIILAVINAANLERSMYLVSELVLLKTPMVIALNMMDVATTEGRIIDPKALSESTGIPVIPMIGTARDQDMKELLHALVSLNGQKAMLPEPAIGTEQIARLLDTNSSLPYPQDWIAGKLIEKDQGIRSLMEESMPQNEHEVLLRALDKLPSTATMDVYKKRQQWIDATCKGCVVNEKGHTSPTDRWDKLLLHPLLGRIIAFLVIPIGSLLGVILGMLTGGIALMAALEAGPQIKAAWPGMLGSLAANALLPSLGWITALAFIIGFIYAIFHFLEDTGYLARVAYLMDPVLGRLGIDGKSAIPLLMGFLCNTVAIAGSRVITTRRQRLITLSMLPFLPCAGQTSVAFLFAFALFPAKTAALVILGITSVNIALACLMGGTINRCLPYPQTKGLVMELPLYHKPNFRTILSGVRTRVELFVKSTAGYIVAALILVWAVSYFPNGNIETSYLYQVGQGLEPIGALFGFDWRFVVALLSSFVAKETTAGTLAVLFSVNVSDQQAIIQAIRSAITPQGALAFVVASNLYIPCIATIGALRSELGSWKTTTALLAVMFVIAVATALAAYRFSYLFL
jgi:ferrous iron transport protein B